MFVPGQRWVSEAEPDNGLGLVVEAGNRTVKVVFSASKQQRIYAVQNAPLLRVCFTEGDAIKNADGDPLVVEERLEQDGLFTYQCRDFDDQSVILPEQDLNDRLRLNRPQDKLLASHIDADTWFSLRYQTWVNGATHWCSPVFGFTGAKVSLIPHQLYIAHEVASRQTPRVLLADEVGLGKTIEAGLIMHRLLLSERVKRVLVVVPEVVLHQWLVEMLRRFNIHFALYDDARFNDTKEANPFESNQRVLCSLEFLTSAPSIAQAVLESQWDLLVVDEAHHLEWSPENTSLQYELIEALASTTPSVLLLTATPEQLGRAGHFARLRLLDPQRFPDYQQFLDEEAQYAEIAHLAGRILQNATLTKAEKNQLTQLVGEVDWDNQEALVNQLVDRHGTSRVLFRNTRQAVQGFPARQVHAYSLTLPAEYKKYAADLTPETRYPRKWPKIDPRLPWLIQKLAELAPQKVLVICAHAKTVMRLRDDLLEQHAVHVAIFHEQMAIVERDRAAVFFADTGGGAQALLCSEMGSEGRNFQFAHHLILFDLPLEPGLLEQRIGRLDRIGQQDTIQIHVPYMQSSASEVLFRWYHEGLNAFEQNCPAGSAVYIELADQLVATFQQPKQLDTLLQTTKQLSQELNVQLEQGRDRLLELYSYRPTEAAELAKQIQQSDKETQVRRYMHRFWDAFGVDHQPIKGQAELVRKGQHMRHEHLPGLTSSSVTVTWDRQDALTHEDRELLTWEHPMVQGAMDMLGSTELGSAAITVCRLPSYKTGTLLVEMLFLSECLAPAVLESQRYLPSTCHRLLLNSQGKNQADTIDHEVLQGLCLTQNKKLVNTVIRSQAKKLKDLFKAGEVLANTRNTQLIQQALHKMTQELLNEEKRLRALAEVNPNVREEEIEQMVARRELLGIHLQATPVRLDAVRLIIMR